jgi:hypothetical protein
MCEWIGGRGNGKIHRLTQRTGQRPKTKHLLYWNAAVAAAAAATAVFVVVVVGCSFLVYWLQP